MCGIAGEIRPRGVADVAAVQRMMEVLAPRGPDGAGLIQRGPVALGHRRLSIIDLSEKAQQPMVDPALGLSIAYNGAIYNYPELRRELEQKGHTFFSSGDTEVLLKAYSTWGKDFVRRLDGMFAFAILERDTGRVLLGRDRLGIKPLYLAEVGGSLRFASTLPALLAGGGVDTDVDPVALHHYLTFHSVVPAPRTILRGVRKLPPGTLLTVEPSGERHAETCWELAFGPRADERDLGERDWEERVLAELRRSVKRRLVADVPVGVLLSGGLDSSLVVGLLAEQGASDLHTFSIGFEAAGGEEGDEFRYSDVIARRFGTRHEKIVVNAERTLEALPRCIAAMTEPMVSHDNVGFYLLSEAVSRHVKVVQSGQGADEIFAGYHWYPPLAESRDPVADYARVFFDRDPAEMRRVLHPRLHGEDASRAFVAEHFARPGAEDPVDRALRLDTTVMLVEDPVKRVDSMTMAFGLEARVPFLAHGLVELAARVPSRWKLAHGGKGVLKQAARRVIPAEVIDRPKGYFPVPALKWLDGPYLEMVRAALTSRRARTRELYQVDHVAELLRAPRDHITPLRSSKLWQLALLELWLEAQGL